MPAGDPSEADRTARISDLRSRFNDSLDERVAAIVAGASAIRVGAWRAGSSEALLTAIHSLAGAAGLFGEDRLGEAAAALERTLVAIQRRTAVTAADIALVRESVQRLERAYQMRGGTP